MITDIDEMPQTGQFVAVWLYMDKIWASTFKWEDGELKRYIEIADEFEPETFPWDGIENVTYMVETSGGH